MNTIIISAQADLGINVDGDQQGSLQLVNDIKGFFDGEIKELVEPTIIKSRNLSDRRKNEYEISRYNTTLYEKELELKENKENFVITLGGDETVTIPSALASKKARGEVGLIYFTGAPLFDTFDTTQNGNLKDLTVAAITGYKNKELRYYQPEPILSTRSVVIGIRELTPSQKENLNPDYEVDEELEEKVSNLVNSIDIDLDEVNTKPEKLKKQENKQQTNNIQKAKFLKGKKEIYKHRDKLMENKEEDDVIVYSSDMTVGTLADK